MAKNEPFLTRQENPEQAQKKGPRSFAADGPKKKIYFKYTQIYGQVP